MKKVLVRICSLALAFLMVLTAVACNSKEQTDEVNSDEVNTLESDSADTEIKPNFSGAKYGYRDFHVLTRLNGSPYEMAIEQLGTTASILERAIYGRNKRVEEDFEVKLVYLTGKTEGDIHNAVSTNSLADADEYDLVASHGIKLFNGALSGYYLDWKTLPTINLDAPWWNQSAKTEFATPGGKLFVMNGSISHNSIGGAGAMYFNKTIIEEAHITSPYTYYEQNNWTFETFFKTVKDAAASMSGDGTTGYMSQTYRGMSGAYGATGHRTLEKGADGKFYIGIENERCYTAQGVFTDFCFESGVVIVESNLSACRTAFKNGTTAFFDDNLFTAPEFEGVNFGIVPFPKYDAQVESYMAYIGSGVNSFAVVSNTSDENRKCIGDIVEALAYYGHKEIIPTYFETVLSYQAMKDEHSLAVLQHIAADIKVDIGSYLNPGQIGLIGSLMQSDPKTYSSLPVAIEKLSGNGQVEAELQLWYALDEQ